MTLTRMRPVILAIFATVTLAVSPAISVAAAGPTAQKGSSGKSGGNGKTVHVKEYKKKDGAVMKAHDRKPSKSKDPSTPTTTPRATHASTRCENCDRDEKGRIVRSQDAKKAFMKATERVGCGR